MIKKIVRNEINAGVRFNENCPPNEMNVYPRDLEEVIDILCTWHEEADLERMIYIPDDACDPEEFIYDKNGFTMMEGSNLGAIAAISNKYIPYIITYAYLSKNPQWLKKYKIYELRKKILIHLTEAKLYSALLSIMPYVDDKHSFRVIWRPLWNDRIFRRWFNLYVQHQPSDIAILYITDLIEERRRLT